MSDPFSTQIRRYIPWDEYRLLEAKQTSLSLMDTVGLSVDQMKARIDMLRGLESDKGFVYFGERQWLQSCCDDNTLISYDDWICNQLETVVFDGPFSRQSDWHLGDCWMAYTENSSLFWQPRELFLDAIKFTDVTLYLRENQISLPKSRLRFAFEILHDLPYFLHQVASISPHDFLLDQLVIQQECKRWDMLLINEFSATWLIQFIGQDMVS